MLLHPMEGNRRATHPLLAWGSSEKKYEWGTAGGAMLMA